MEDGAGLLQATLEEEEATHAALRGQQRRSSIWKPKMSRRNDEFYGCVS